MSEITNDAESSVVEMVGASYSGAIETKTVPTPGSDQSSVSKISTEEVIKFGFDADFQTRVLYLSLYDQTFMRRVAHLLKPEYFESSAEAAFMVLVLNHWKNYNSVMADDVVILRCLADAKEKKVLRESAIQEIKVIVRGIFEKKVAIRKGEIEGLNSEFIADKVAEFVRQQAFIAAISKSVDLIDRGDYAKIEKLVLDANRVGIEKEESGGEYFERLLIRTNERANESAGLTAPRGITTGHFKLDSLLYHRGWGRKELNVLMGGPKAGKCVKRDTIIFTEDGLSEIGDYVPSNVRQGEFKDHEMKVLGRNGFENTSHVYNSGLNPTLKIQTHRGFEIEGTLHHPMLVLRDGRHEWVRLDELKLGDQMAVQRGAKVFGKHVDISYAAIAAVSRTTRGSNSVVYPEAMSEELAEFLGMFIAEGYCGKDGAMTFTQKDEIILARYVDLCKKLFNVSPKLLKREGKITQARMQSVGLQAYLEALGVEWRASSHKVVPKAILRSPEKTVAAFLRTLIGLECHIDRVSDGKVSFDLCMASEKLITQVQLLLLNFGVVCRKTLKPGMATNGSRIVRNYWRLLVTGSRNIEALALLGLYEQRKNDELAGDRSDTTARDWIPGSRNLIEDIMKEIQTAGFSLKGSFSSTEYKQLRRYRGEKAEAVRELTFAYAEKLVRWLDLQKVNGPRSDELRAIVKSGYCYDPVTLIENGECETVDLTVPDTHSFFANGLISHNTTALIEFASAGCMANYNVLYVTLEVSNRIVEERADARFTDTPISDLVGNFADVNAKVEALALRSKIGRFYIAEFPSGGMSPSMLSSLLERHKSKGWTYDMVVVDYADIMCPDYRTNEVIENSKQIYLGLRAIAQEWNCVMLTATQSNREGSKAIVAKSENVADDFNKVRTADLFISINSTDEEKKDNKARLYFAASRNQRSGMSVSITQDFSRGRFLKTIEGIE